MPVGSSSTFWNERAAGVMCHRLDYMKDCGKGSWNE